VAENKAKAVRDRLRNGEKFSELARQYSDNAIAVRNDGLLGTFLRGELSRAIEDVVFSQDSGYITDPIRVGDALEILKIEQRTNNGQATFDEARSEINDRMMESMAGPKLHAYLVDLRRTALLQIKEGYEDSGAAPGKDTSWRATAAIRPETIVKEAVAGKRHANRLIPK
jgi:parvulin-like peptidyl-prolyl isomerase